MYGIYRFLEIEFEADLTTEWIAGSKLPFLALTRKIFAPLCSESPLTLIFFKVFMQAGYNIFHTLP